jgi:glycerol-1-phosphate dehydrogenase [NAD(P)+]
VSLCEWRISNLVTGEYYARTSRIVRRSVKKIVDNAERLSERDPTRCRPSSRVWCSPASRCRTRRCPAGVRMVHYFLHMWEMMGMERGIRADLHGSR